MGAMGTTTSQARVEDGCEEPVIQKKLKMNPGSHFSTKEQTNEYEKMANEYTDELRYKATSELLIKDDGNAFAQKEIDTDEAHDARAVKLRQIQRSKDIKAGLVDTKAYAGEAGYAIYAEKSEKDIANSKYTGSLGPIRAPSNIRATVRFDYNPSLCKDWHDTGYCGFGDSCIYIHDRGDYKSGWEMEKEWEQEQAEKAKRFSVTTGGYQGDAGEEEEEEEEGPPRKCQACEEEFKNPVVTSCKHYFCENCIFAEYRNSKKCPVCSRSLNGIFNIAHDVVARDKAEGKKAQRGGNQGKDKGKIVLNQNEGPKVEKRRREESEGLEGVEFGSEGENESEQEEEAPQVVQEKEEDEEDFHTAKLVDEYNKGKKKQSKFQIQSDWLYS